MDWWSKNTSRPHTHWTEREDAFIRLEGEGIREFGELLVVALMGQRERHVFGRRKMPEMDVCSVSCAIQNMWLAAWAEGICMCWISIFDPVALSDMLAIPADAKPVAILCVGHVTAFYPRPMLEQEGWAKRQSLQNLISENSWRDDGDNHE